MPRSKWNPFTVEQWIAWIVATGAAGFTITAYAFREFETKADAKTKKEDIQREADFRWAEAKDQLRRIEEGIRELRSKR